jgi:hypothetical protein
LHHARRAAASLEAVRTALPARRLRLAFADASTAHSRVLDLLLESAGPAHEVVDALEALDARASSDAKQGHTRSSSANSPDEVRRAALGRDLTALYSMLADAGAADARHVAWRTERERIERELNDLDLRIETSAAVRTGRAQRSSTADARDLLESGESIIRFGMHRGEVVAAAISRGGATVTRRLGSEQDLDRLVRALHFQMRRAALQADPGDVSTAHELLSRLDRLLGSVVRDAIERFGERAIVVPAGPAALVPFHALPSLDTSVALVTTAPSVASLAAALSMPAIEQPRRVLSIGVADELIRGAADEARAVAQAWREAEVTCLTDEAATAAAVRSALPAADLVHIASHGWFAPTACEASGLRLADRWFHRHELRDLCLRADMVVLSGCETGPGGCGGDAQGLYSGFLASGARRVLASLWTVRDEICASFMARLHTRWQTIGLGSASRVWAEQVAELRSEHPHPAHWAPFMLSGSPR